jgi:hypothetical protein
MPPGKPRRAPVDTTPALDEITQRLIQVLELRGVPQSARPLAPRPVIDLVTICRAEDHSGEWFRLPEQVVPSQLQRPASPVDRLAFLVPPRDQFENAGQITHRRHRGDGWLEPLPTHFAIEFQVLQVLAEARRCLPGMSSRSSWAVAAGWTSSLRSKTGWWSVHGRAWLDPASGVHEAHRVTAGFELGRGFG